MILKTARFSLSTYIVVVIIVSFMSASGIFVFSVREGMRDRALVEAQDKAKILLDHTMAVHDFFSNELKPSIFSLTDKYRSPGYFDPNWMSSTYANRHIQQYFAARNKGAYYLKECAINARTPENEANPYERAFIQELNADSGLEVRSTVMDIDGQPFFVVLRRGENMSSSCLRCHSNPDKAPKGLVDIYGPSRSFDRKQGETISAVSIRIPLSEAYAEADRFSWRLSALLVFALFVISFAQVILHRFLVMKPLTVIKGKALLIAAKEEHLGERIAIDTNREFQELADAFSVMSENLRLQRDHLDEKVAERTRELSEALDNIKTLKGMLPICASCKKIRDDKGYWNQIETYIQQHTDVAFSHGICPECMKRLYPEMMDDEGDFPPFA